MSKNKIFIWGLILGLLVSLAFLGGCVPTGETQGGFDWTLVIFLVAMFAVFYFLMIRPQSKRQKEQRRLIEELKNGDRVITSGGIFGEIERVSDDSVVLKVESGATIRVVKNSIAGKQTG